MKPTPTLLFAALLLADELYEAKNRPAAAALAAGSLDALAERLESVADALEFDTGLENDAASD